MTSEDLKKTQPSDLNYTADNQGEKHLGYTHIGRFGEQLSQLYLVSLIIMSKIYSKQTNECTI